MRVMSHSGSQGSAWHYFDEEDLQAVKAVLDAGALGTITDSPPLKALEQDFCDTFNSPYAMGVVNAMAGGGSLLTVAATGQTINLLSIIGMVALLGIAVNDAIIKIDTMRRLRADGMDGYQAILEASRLRLRPIVMTSATTILAMLPMAIGLGSGEQLQRPLALTIMGGLFLTTTTTLFYTPLLYMLVHRIRRPAS